MPRYDRYLNVRIDPIVDRAIESLASKWGLKERYRRQKEMGKKPRGYRSEAVRMAIVYAYLVDVLKVDPRLAPDKAIEYLARVE